MITCLFFLSTPPSFCLRKEGGGRKKEIRPAQVPVLLITGPDMLSSCSQLDSKKSNSRGNIMQLNAVSTTVFKPLHLQSILIAH